MEIRVCVGASLVVLSTGLAACSAPAGKTEMTQVCLDRFGGATETCECFVSTAENRLSEDGFATLSKAIHDNRRLCGDWIPGAVRARQDIRLAVREATEACFS